MRTPRVLFAAPARAAHVIKLSNHKMKSLKGFTLLELLVVIGIIAILVSLGVSSYSTAQKKARDAKRQSELKSFQNAMEQCYSVNDYQYPLVTGNGTTTISETCTAPTGPSMTIRDPSTKTYNVSSSTTAYSISVILEDGNTFTISQLQ